MKSHPHLFVGLVLIASLSFAPAAEAQLLWRWWGPKAIDKSAPAKSMLADPRRSTEINVEIAWLADPVTFPYYLEAHATASHLEVRGYVPSKAVKEHALRIAQVYSSLPVADALKEHPSLMVKSSQMSAQQLQTSVQSSLRVALPKQYQQLKTECSNDGKVFVVGTVSCHEEKMAVSHALRRLHGCTSVQNLTTLPDDVAQNQPPREKVPIVKTSNPRDAKADKPLVAQETKSKSWFTWPFGKNQTTRDEPPLLEPRKPENKGTTLIEGNKPAAQDGPILIPNIPEPTPTPKAPVALNAAELQKRIKAACPQTKSVEVQLTSGREVRITLEIRDEKELSPTAERVFALPELQNYRPELQFKISAP